MSELNLFNELRKYENDINNHKAIAIIWSVDDVMQQAQGDGVSITVEQASDILIKMKNNHDACFGICWETISSCIRSAKQ